MSSILKALKNLEKESQKNSEKGDDTPAEISGVTVSNPISEKLHLHLILKGGIAILSFCILFYVAMIFLPKPKHPFKEIDEVISKNGQTQEIKMPTPMKPPPETFPETDNEMENAFSDREEPPPPPSERQMTVTDLPRRKIPPEVRQFIKKDRPPPQRPMPETELEKQHEVIAEAPPKIIKKREPMATAALPKTTETQKPVITAPNITQRTETTAEDIEILHDTSKIKIQAISWAPDAKRRIAVINNQIVKEGGTIDQYRIDKIDKSFVILRENGKQWRLEFGR